MDAAKDTHQVDADMEITQDGDQVSESSFSESSDAPEVQSPFHIEPGIFEGCGPGYTEEDSVCHLTPWMKR